MAAELIGVAIGLLIYDQVEKYKRRKWLREDKEKDEKYYRKLEQEKEIEYARRNEELIRRINPPKETEYEREVREYLEREK